MSALTLTEQRIYRYIREFVEKNGRGPTRAEIAAGVGMKSRGTVQRYVQALAAAGLIEVDEQRWHGIRLKSGQAPADKHPDGRDSDDWSLPLLGRIAAGQPIEAVADEQTLDLRLLGGANRYALRVRGESMIEAGILDGDTVIVEACEAARNGDIVVALIEGGEVTLKYYHPRPDGTVLLVPANARMEPMRFPVDSVRVQGRVVGQLRLY